AITISPFSNLQHNRKSFKEEIATKQEHLRSMSPMVCTPQAPRLGAHDKPIPISPCESVEAKQDKRRLRHHTKTTRPTTPMAAAQGTRNATQEQSLDRSKEGQASSSQTPRFFPSSGYSQQNSRHVPRCIFLLHGFSRPIDIYYRRFRGFLPRDRPRYIILHTVFPVPSTNYRHRFRHFSLAPSPLLLQATGCLSPSLLHVLRAQPPVQATAPPFPCFSTSFFALPAPSGNVQRRLPHRGPAALAPLQERSPVSVPLQGVRVPDHHHPSPRPGYRNVQPAPVREETYPAAVVGSHCGQDDH
ncbi:unnamed protein product, partial [Ectocarpus fasciculatus]